MHKFEKYPRLQKILSKKYDFDNLHTVKKMINKRFKYDPLKNKQRCLSSIDQGFIGHIPSEEFMKRKQPEEKLILAYFPAREEDIHLMGSYDLMTSYDKDRSDPSRKRVPHKDNFDDICNLKLEDLNNVTMGDDNEIVVDSYPGAVICFDKVSNIAKKTAKKYNLPLLYINTREQFKIMQSKIYEYYEKLQTNLSKVSNVSNEMFEQAFNDVDKENNIIHRAFKLVNGFSYLDEEELPKNEIAEIISKMKILTIDFIKKCDSRQKEQIQDIIDEETDTDLLRYTRRYHCINYAEFENFVENSQKNDFEVAK